jgi:hypothetical protein
MGASGCCLVGKPGRFSPSPASKAARAKMRREHPVPLLTEAIAVLRQLQGITGGNRLVFPGFISAAKPISENTLNCALRRIGYTADQMTSHGSERPRAHSWTRAVSSASTPLSGRSPTWKEMLSAVPIKGGVLGRTGSYDEVVGRLFRCSLE